MNLIIDFYKGLDTVNLILFWGTIIVVLLLLIFAIIITHKNKKLKDILIEKELELDDAKNELAIKTETQEETIIEKEVKKDEPDSNIEINNTYIKEEPKIEVPIVKEKELHAEEHVMPDNSDLFVLPNIEKNNKAPREVDIEIPTKPYERNVLRGMSSNQTSPIGIVKNDVQEQTVTEKAEELNASLNESEVKEIPVPPKPRIEIEKRIPRGNYLEELSKKMQEANNEDGIKRTDYELKQEEDAIISYEELMKKKDSIKTIDEEDAIISVEELLSRKNKNERLYNITKEETNEKFIDELKDFRSDL